MTRPRHRSVLWSARYPCRLSDPDSPPALTLAGLRQPFLADLAPPHQALLVRPPRARTNRLLTSRSRFRSQAHLGDFPAEIPGRCSGMHATPVRYRFPTARRLYRSPVRSAFLLKCLAPPHQALLEFSPLAGANESPSNLTVPPSVSRPPRG